MTPRGEADHDGSDDAGAAPAGPPAGRLTLAAYLHDWLALQATQVEASTWRAHAGAVRRYVEPALGDLALDALEPAALTAFYARLLTEGGDDGGSLALRTVRRCHAVLHKAYADAVAVGLVASNPCERATVPRRDPSRADGGRGELAVWTTAQLRAFLDLTRDHRFSELWVLAAGTGMRRGELLGLAWSDVDLDAAAVTVRASLSVVDDRVERKPPKSGRPRTIGVDAHVVAALERRRRRQAEEQAAAGPTWDHRWDLVFTTLTGGHLSPDGVSHAFRRLVETLPLPPLHLHGLRHTHASHLLRLQVPVKVVSARLGHASVDLTMTTYAHLLPGMDTDAVAVYRAALYGDDEAVDGDASDPR